jgi:galactokinase/mevalonate kinase-like predicted kinase
MCVLEEFMQSLFEKLKKAEEQNVVPGVVAYNRIDGPGSSLDIREFQQALWRKTDVTAYLDRDPEALWSKGLPRTVGITIDTGTRVEAHPLDGGRIGVRSVDYDEEITAMPGEVPPVKKYWLLKLMDVFGLSGVMFVIKNLRPGLLSAGLGGSATVATAVCVLANELTGKPFGDTQLISMASRMETDLGISITGTQEQSNVVYGGVMDYIWFPWGIPGQPNSGYGSSVRYELMSREYYEELEARMAIFHSGISRASADTNAVWRKTLATPDGLKAHIRKAEIAYDYREGLRLRDWNRVKEAIGEYRRARADLCPQYMHGAREITEHAEAMGGTTFPLGAGGGGGVMVFHPDPEELMAIRGDLKGDYREVEFRLRGKGCEVVGFE